MSTNGITSPDAIPGRWAISGTGLSNAILLDTATGETWHANHDGFWVRMIHAEDFSGALSYDALRRATEKTHVERMEHVNDMADLPRRATP